MPAHSIPEITVRRLSEKLRSQDSFVLLDVREPWELDQARIDDARLKTAPMSLLARQGLKALPADASSPQAEIYVLCHQGARSAQVTAWLASQGWTNVYSVSGGIDEYARTVDRRIGLY